MARIEEIIELSSSLGSDFGAGYGDPLFGGFPVSFFVSHSCSVFLVNAWEMYVSGGDRTSADLLCSVASYILTLLDDVVASVRVEREDLARVARMRMLLMEIVEEVNESVG